MGVWICQDVLIALITMEDIATWMTKCMIAMTAAMIMNKDFNNLQMLQKNDKILDFFKIIDYNLIIDS